MRIPPFLYSSRNEFNTRSHINNSKTVPYRLSSRFKKHFCSIVLAAFAIFASVSIASAQQIDFESPTFTTGNINGQNGWVKLGSYDAEVASSSVLGFGSQSLRISNGVASGSFGDQTFSSSITNEAGEASAENGGMSGGTRQNVFQTEFSIASAVPGSQQTGLVISVSPDRGDGARMSYLRFEDQADGIRVYFDDYVDAFPFGTTVMANSPTGCGATDDFQETLISTLDRTVPHKIKLVMHFFDGPRNDVVQVFVDGVLRITGTSWEDYFRYCEGHESRTVDSLIFRAGGTSAPTTLGNGFLFDNLTNSSSTASFITATPADTKGWFVSSNTVGGNVSYVNDYTAPSGSGALRLTTIADNQSRAHYRHPVSMPLSSVNEMSFYAKTNSNGPAHESASYSIGVNLDGTPGSFTELVFEPYWNYTPGNPSILKHQWQKWDVFNGQQFWASNTVNVGGGCSVTAGSGGAPFYTIQAMQAACPNAQIVYQKAYIGSYNQLYDIEVDLFSLNNTVYDFETSIPTVEKVTAADLTPVPNATDWLIYDDVAEAINNSLVSFVTGPATPQYGAGSAQISVTGSQRHNLATYQFAGTPLADITALRFSVYNPSIGNGGSSTTSSYLNFNVDFNGSDTWQRRLVFLPGDNGSVIQDTWKEWDAINSGQALWQYSGATWPGGSVAGTTPKTWSQILSEYPGVRVRVTDAFFGVRVGNPDPAGYTENIDSVTFGTANSTTIFDFEPVSMVDDDGMASSTDCDAGDSAFTTIQSAVNAATPGALIKVCPGTYNEGGHLSIAKSVSVISVAGAATTIIDGQQIAPVAKGLVYISTPLSETGDVTFSGFTVKNPGTVSGVTNGVFAKSLSPQTTITVSNNKIEGLGATDSGFWTYASRGPIVFNNNEVVGTGYNPILIEVASGGSNVYGNTVTANSGYFNMTYNSSGLGDITTLQRVANNTFNGAAVSFYGAFNGTASKFTNIQVTNNVLTNAGITLNNSHGAIGSIENSVISGNKINRANTAGSYGVRLNGQVLNTSITCNTLVAAVDGIRANPVGADSPSGTVASGNNFIGNGFGINNLGTNSINGQSNWWGAADGPSGSGPGSGAAVSSNVDFSNFLTSASGCAAATPTVTINHPLSQPDPANAGPIHFVVTFSEPVTGFDNTDVVLGGTTGANAVTVSGSGASYDVYVSGMSADGVLTATIPAGAAIGSTSGTGNSPSTSTDNSVYFVVTCSNVAISTGVTTLRNQQVTVPINVDDVTGRNILGYDTVITYDSSKLTYLGFDNAGTLSSNMSITVNSTVANQLTISAFSAGAPPSGAGALLKLRFFAAGTIDPVPTPINFSSFVFNEGIPCSILSNGDVTIISSTISGAVTYVNAPSTRPVPNVNMNAAGSVNTSAVTDSAGNYSLSGMGSGSYVVTPSKAAQPIATVNGITNFDSTTIAQSLVGFLTLSANQIKAADVTGNGAVSNLDASYIAQWSTGVLNPGSTGTWKFIPASRSYTNAETPQSNQNYDAILMGDVTGNWNPLLPPFLASSGIESKPSKDAVVLKAPIAKANSGSKVEIPITISDITGKNVTGYQFDLAYDPMVIEPLAETELLGTLSDGLNVTVNSPEPGLLKVFVFGVMPMSGEGDLIKLQFSAIGSVGTSTPVAIRSLLLNEGGIETAAVAGEVRIVESSDGGVIRGRLLTGQGLPVAGTRVVIAGVDGQKRAAVSSSFGYFEFNDLEIGESYTVNVLSKRHRFASQSVSVLDSIVMINLIAQE